MDRGRKRPEIADQLPADKRACSSSEFRPAAPDAAAATATATAGSSSSSSSLPPPSSSELPDCDMESSSSGRGGGDSAYGSCESDDDPHHHQPRMGCGASRGKFQRMLSVLDADDAGPSAQLASLTELCEALSFCVEDSLGYFPMDSALPSLVRLAGSEGDPDIMLLAIRAITYLCDVIPRSADAVVRHGALPVLCDRLLSIEYLDVAEQSLQALDKISRKQPVPCLKAGAVMAVLGFLDFFSTSVQRLALSTVANVCKKLPSDCSSLVLEVIPTLCNILQYEDNKLVETAVTCLIRITECFSNSNEILDELCKHGVIGNSLHLITVDGRTTLSQTAFVGLIGLLTKLATDSPVAIRTLFELGVSSSLKRILIASGVFYGTNHSYSEGVYCNQVYEVLKLLNQMMPSEARDDGKVQLVLAKEKILEEQPAFLRQFSSDILPVLIEVVKSGANLSVCYGCLSVMNNIIYFSNVDMLQDLLKDSNISSFLAGLLARKDRHVLISALKIVELLMQKFSFVCSSSFIKEGVVYSVEMLLEHENQSDSLGQKSDQQDNQMALRDVSRCSCYVLDQLNTNSSERKVCGLGKDAVVTLAKYIKATYFADESVNCEVGVSKDLKKLKIMCSAFNEAVDQSSFIDDCSKIKELTRLLGQVICEINLGEAISCFEFVESGIIRSLVHYLSNGRYLSKDFYDCLSATDSFTILKRLQTFTGISFSKAGQNCEDMFFTILVRKLQDALTAFDNFPVIVSQFFKPRSHYSDIPTKHSTLLPCLRVHFVREVGELDLSDFSDVLSVEVSSSFVTIEEHLWPKICTSSSELQKQKGKDKSTNTEVTTVRCSEVNVPQEIDPNIQHIPSTNFAQALNYQEQQASLEDTSLKLKEMMTENNYSPQPSSEGHAEGSKLSSSSSDDATSKLMFSIEGREIDRSMNIYQAILQFHLNAESDLVVGPKFWTDVYKVSFRKASQVATNSQANSCDSQSFFLQEKAEYPWHKLPFISCLFFAELPCKLDKSNPSYDLLFMMKVLEGLNRFSSYLLSYERSVSLAEGRIENFDCLNVVAPSIPHTEFISTKLSDKLEQQLQDPLTLASGSMPSWCDQLMMACPFLYSFETRWKYFRLTTFGCKSNQMQVINTLGPGAALDRRLSTGWSYRKKFKVTRLDILGSAVKMMALHAQSRAVIEVEYEEEVGTGLGPTMEFFTLVSHEFQKVGMGLWRGDKNSFNDSQTSQSSDKPAFVPAPFGLFPYPWDAAACISDDKKFSDVIKKFCLLGQLVAKAIRDGRIMDIPFCHTFYKVILDQELGIYDIQSFDPELGRTLLEFQALSLRKRFLEAASSDNTVCAYDLCFRNTAIEDLCLDFTLPGYSDFLLFPAADSKMVDIHNLEEYVSLVVNATIKDGISRQVQAFKSGFNEVFPLGALKIFTEDELERLLCGEQDTWTFSELLDHVKFDHGYTASSPPVINLLETIQEFECNQRRAFLQFVTGAPRLPLGGLAALNPRLTIVRKLCCHDVDMDLPSVMTCANYLKLPPYSTKERMRERLLYAIAEGQGSFHLS